MKAILGISFETPSVKELTKLQKLLEKNTSFKTEVQNLDYMKLIKDKNNDRIGVCNRELEIHFFKEIDTDRKESILALITNRYDNSHKLIPNS